MPTRSAAPRPHKRKGFWYLVRRVPAKFASHDKRRLVMLSTGIPITDDPRGNAARLAVAELDASLLRYWHDLKDGRDPEAESLYKQALKTARDLGVPYAPARDISELPLLDIIRRVDLVDNGQGVESTTKVSAVLGGEQPPTLMLSKMRETFERIVATTLLQKSNRQIKRWRTNRDTAVETFLQVLCGDRPISSLSRADALALRAHWQARVIKGEVEIDTANKGINRVSGMFQAINENRMLGLPAIFDKTSIRGGKEKQRVAFSPAFVQAKFMADGVFATLNPEARRVIYLVAETGLRLSEACNLSKETIRLDHPVPHVQVRADGREMKTDQSRRDIPLVGVALLAMQAQPDGFPRYRDKADHLSALVNKVLETHKLRPEPGQSLYSLRHTFEDRLTAVEAPEKVVAALMGHKWHRPRYGLGPSLEQKAVWLNRIVFKPPTAV